MNLENFSRRDIFNYKRKKIAILFYKLKQIKSFDKINNLNIFKSKELKI